MSTTERVFHIEAQDRQSFISELDIALALSGGRIGAGVYEVTILRLSKKEVDRLAAENAVKTKLDKPC